MGIIRYVAKTKKSQSATIQLICHVKPGASQAREGVAAVTSDAIELCVSAQAKDGEANKAVTVLLSRVRQYEKPNPKEKKKPCDIMG